MRWSVLLVTALSLLHPGCGGPEAPLLARPPVPREDVAELPSGVSTMPSSEATVEGAVPEAACGQPARFAPNDRFGWPSEFLLPLIIEMEIPEVPEAIRGPSPPIDKET